MEPADGVEDVDSIRNEICSSLAKSAFDGRRYLPLDQLCKILSPSVVRQFLLRYFEESKVSEYEIEVLGSQDGDTPVPPRRRRIFAILVMAKQVNRLAKFIEDNVDDTALPLHFDQVEKPKRESQVSYTLHRQDEVCQQGGHDRHNENQQDQHMTKEFDMWPCDVAQDFMLWQPIIHVPFFKFPGDKIYFYDLRQDSVLPFGEYDQQETGGYGSVHDNGPDLNHLIPLQLTFKHGRDYYLVFPWADGNLKKFWRQRSANPKDPDEVRWFMAQCSGIARGLRKLHHLSTQLSSQKAANANSVNAINGTEMILGGKEWGRHGDIKPENILWFENYKGERDFLVISDFGLTQFNSAHSRSKVQQDQILGYSGTYRPPDLHLENQPISQNYDVWSLGCVFLEFLSWFLLGYREAVDVFAQERLKDGPKGEVREDTFFTFEKGDKEPHDMSKRAMLKESVVQWIEKLHKIPECTEPFHSLLDLIQFTMLVPNSDDRSKCRPVDTRLRRLASRYEAFEPQASRISPSASARTVRKSQRADIALSNPGPTQESTEPQVTSSGAQFDDIPRILDHDDAARDSSDDLTGGHASIEEIASNAETSSRNVIAAS
ncbi:hypothetical protein CEP52_009892 [Fusarium oligoseptatum]|uniref:Protein kinase domain-containing protein n=1 Tax=Fusarium oligoseptatum TaxID=2604345 RepID=A0A428TB15_9HYPO|nr:hypothetical protein CEP52_009892 [Fusarium oligoseptatum]